MVTNIRRSCWETNSSSIHQIVIAAPGGELEKPPPTVWLHPDDFDFGWFAETYSDFDGKLHYVFAATFLHELDRLDRKRGGDPHRTLRYRGSTFDQDIVNHAVELFCNVIHEIGIERIVFPPMDFMGDGSGFGYNPELDQAGAKWCDMVKYLCMDTELLRRFLLDPRSMVNTANDGEFNISHFYGVDADGDADPVNNPVEPGFLLLSDSSWQDFDNRQIWAREHLSHRLSKIFMLEEDTM